LRTVQELPAEEAATLLGEASLIDEEWISKFHK